MHIVKALAAGVTVWLSVIVISGAAFLLLLPPLPSARLLAIVGGATAANLGCTACVVQIIRGDRRAAARGGAA